MASRVLLMCVLLLLNGAGTSPVHAFWKEVGGAALGIGAVAVGGPLVLGAVGFTGTGIATGSVGASMMSTAATYGAGMGAVGALQSAGAAGVGAATYVAGAAVGALAAHSCSDE